MTDDLFDFLEIQAIIEEIYGNFRVWIVTEKDTTNRTLTIEEIYAKYDKFSDSSSLNETLYDEVKYRSDIKFIFDKKEKSMLMLKYVGK